MSLSQEESSKATLHKQFVLDRIANELGANPTAKIFRQYPLLKPQEVNIEVESLTWSFHKFSLKTVINPKAGFIQDALVDDMLPTGMPVKNKGFWITDREAKNSIVVGVISAFINAQADNAKRAIEDELQDQAANALEAIENDFVN